MEGIISAGDGGEGVKIVKKVSKRAIAVSIDLRFSFTGF